MNISIPILHLITELNFGGAEQLLVNMLLHSRPDRFSHEVVTLFAGDTPLAEALRCAVHIGVTFVTDASRRSFRFRRRASLNRPDNSHASILIKK